MARRPLAAALLFSFTLLAAAQAFAVAPSPPTFASPRNLPQSSGFGEPSLAAAPDGTLYVTAPGSHSALWRSRDGGSVWARVADSFGSSGDSDVAVDARGVVYVSDLFSSVPVSVSFDQGTSFAYERQTISGASIDRQWTAAAGDGHVFSVVRDGSTEKIAISHDRGVSYTVRTVVTGVGLQGNIVAVDENTLLIPYGGSGMRLAKSTNGGLTWTSHLVHGSSSTTLFPAVAADAAGNYYMAWSAKSNENLGNEIKFASSRDGGLTWSTPIVLSERLNTAIFPWIVAGDEGRVAVAWYDGRTPGGQSANADVAPLTEWYVSLAYTQLGTSGRRSDFVVVDATPRVHTGPICTMGTLCFPVKNPVAFNRALLDFFEIAMAPDGDILLTYSADPAQVNPTGATVLKFVRQSGGPNLKL